MNCFPSVCACVCVAAAAARCLRRGAAEPTPVNATRRAYKKLSLARILLRQSAQPAHWQPKASWADVQAFVSFVGDCPDAEAAEDVLSALLEALHRGSPAHPLLAGCLRAHGGPRLFASLLQREQPGLRLLGLQLLAAFVQPPAPPGSPPAAAGGAAQSELEGLKEAAHWTGVADLVLMWPLTPPLRAVLLELLCVGPQAPQAQRPGGPAVPLIGCPPVVGMFLRLLPGCEDAGERLHTLEALAHLCVDGPPENRARVAALPGWQDWLLQLLLQQRRQHLRALSRGRSPSISASEAEALGDRRGSLGSESSSSGRACEGREGRLLRALLRALLGHCARCEAGGWRAAEDALFRLRELGGGSSDAWLLGHTLLADAIADLAGSAAPAEAAAAAADAWTLVSALAAQPARANALGLLGLADQLAGGGLLAPEGAALQPDGAALAWAEGGSRAGEDVPPAVWAALGMGQDGAAPPTPQVAWQLWDGCWQLLALLQRAQEASASLQPPTAQQQQQAASGSGSLPFGLDRRLASLPVLGWQSGKQAEEGEEAKAAAANALCLRLLPRLLLRYLLGASPANARAALQQGLHLLPALLDASQPGPRGQAHLLLAALSHAFNACREPERRPLLCEALQALLPALAGVFAANGLPLLQLPSAEDAQFALAVEGALQGGRAAEAARATLLSARAAAIGQERGQQSRAAAAVARQAQERQLRQNLAEDARQALGLILESERGRRAAARAASEEEAQALARAWRAAWRNLAGEGGVWADPAHREEVHWKLDKHEDPSRRRLRLKRNYKFQRYRQPARGGAFPAAAAEPEPPALPGVRLRRQGSGGAEPPPPDTPSPRQQPGGSSSSAAPSPRGSLEQPREAAEELDKVLLATPCQLVSPKRVVPGVLSLTPGQLHFSGDIPAEDGAGSPRGGRRCYRRWTVADVAEAHHTRFLLRPTALELFLADRSNALLCFPTQQAMREVARQLQALSPGCAVFDRRRKQEAAARLQAAWQRWELSNFDYLMQLNRLAGRTYNDLNQYPVFPWVLADYSSERLDLQEAATFRDLSKPVGALDPKRAAFFRERFEGLRADPASETPPFHYGTHYSSAGAVLFFLLRLEPFTGLARALQGGRFDHADRLFHSVGEAWANALTNTSDVRELTPEFFYQPHFLRNADAFDLGTRQDGTALGDVRLPPWARGSPEEFVRLQREALEGEHVSARLHAWLDLVFGAAQRGKAAEEACNVFFHLTYEGAVDLDDIADPFQRKAVEDQISFFGQTPSQLFTKRHPKRGPPPPPASHPLLNCPEAMRLAVVARPPTHRPNGAVARLAQCEGRLLVVGADRSVATHRWLSPRDLPAFTFAGMQADAGFSVEPDPAAPRTLGTPFATDLDAGHCYCVLPGGQVVVSCGYWDNSVRAYAVDSSRLLQSARQHRDIATCLALSPDGATLVSGSRDTTVLVWDTAAAAAPRGGARQRGRGPAPLPLRPEPRCVLHGHSAAVACLALCPPLDLVFSAGAEGGLLAHALSTGRLVARMELPGGVAAAHLVASAATARVVAHSHQDLGLHALTAHGRPLVSAECSERLAALAASPDGRFLLTAGAKGAVTLRWLHTLQEVLRYDPQRGPLTALAVTAEECVLAGGRDGSLLVLAPDPRRTASRRLDPADAAPLPVAPVIKFEA